MLILQKIKAYSLTFGKKSGFPKSVDFTKKQSLSIGLLLGKKSGFPKYADFTKNQSL